MSYKKNWTYNIKRILYSVFVRGIHLKLISLLIAFGLWFAVTSSEKADAVKKIPLDFVTAPGLVVSADTPYSVDIKITGPRIFVRKVLERKEYIKIDIRDKREGVFYYKFYSGMMQLPIGIKADDFYPSGINVKLEKLKTKKVKVVASVTGQPMNGYKLVSYSVEPSMVEISGSEGVLSKTSELYTALIDVSTFKEPKHIDVVLDANYSSFLESVSVEKFTAFIDVQPVVIEKRFNDLKIDVIGGKDRCSFSPERADVVVSGSKEAIERLDIRSLRAYIDISFNAPGKHKEDIKIKQPEGIKVLAVHPKKVDVVVHRGE